jgi:predicted N-acetyltransferase YhbS
MELTFTYLADRPELISLLASWFYREWGHQNLMITLEMVERNLEKRLSRDRVPLTFIAFFGNEAIGSASLKIREMEIYPQFLHWLGSVYVIEGYRNQGVGGQIVQHSVSVAKKLAVKELYLYTRNHEKFYAKFGWQTIEKPVYHGREVVVMKRTMSW